MVRIKLANVMITGLDTGSLLKITFYDVYESLGCQLFFGGILHDARYLHIVFSGVLFFISFLHLVHHGQLFFGGTAAAPCALYPALLWTRIYIYFFLS